MIIKDENTEKLKDTNFIFSLDNQGYEEKENSLRTKKVYYNCYSFYESVEDFNIFINGELIKFTKEYKFNSSGKFNVKYVLYNDISMDYMFKGIESLISVEMVSTKNAQIKSMISTFEKCKRLEKFTISGFNTKNIKSLHKLFYETAIYEVDFKSIDTSNVEDYSYMLSLSNIETFNFSEFLN